MSLFVLDAAGDKDLKGKNTHPSSSVQVEKRRSRFLLKEKPQALLGTAPLSAVPSNADEDDSEDDGDFFGLPPPNVDISNIIASALEKTAQRKTKVEQQLAHVSELVDGAVANAKAHPRSKRGRVTELDYSDFNELTGKLDAEQLVQTDVTKEMANSAMVPGLEQLKQLSRPSRQKQAELNRLERAKTKGANWYNMPATEVTEEVQNDLKLIQMRSVLDPKHFYKKNDLKVLPKYFQIGTVQHSPLDWFSERNVRKNKKKSLVDELLADTDALNYTKRKYKEIVMRRDIYARRKAMKKMKKLKKNK